MTFGQTGASEEILNVMHKMEWKSPFPIQSQAIPILLSGRDVLAMAQTGSGKTAAFSLPLMRHVLAQRPCSRDDGPIAVILSPTRELAVQIHSCLRNLTAHTSLRSRLAVGGDDIKGILREFKQGIEVLVATPGRFIDVITKRKKPLLRTSFFVVDEV